MLSLAILSTKISGLSEENSGGHAIQKKVGNCSFLIIIINIININIIVNILSCFGPKPLLHVILRATSD